MKITKIMDFLPKCHSECFQKISYLHTFLPRRRKQRFRMEIPRISWNCVKLCEIHVFMEKCEFHVKSPESNLSCPRQKTAVNHRPFCMVRRPFGCFWSQNGEIHWIPPILAKFHSFWWNLVKIGDFGGFGGGNGAFTRSSSNTQCILGILGAFLAQIGTFHQIPPILGDFQ